MSCYSRCRLGIISTSLLLLTACTLAPDPKLRPAQLWHDAGLGWPPVRGRIEDRKLLGTFTMEAKDTCVLRLNDGTVTRRPDNWIRERCYQELFQSFVKNMPRGQAYGWGDITQEKPEGVGLHPTREQIEEYMRGMRDRQ